MMGYFVVRFFANGSIELTLHDRRLHRLPFSARFLRPFPAGPTALYHSR